MDRRVFLLAAIALGGCATVAAPPGVAPGRFGDLGELEPLFGVARGAEGFTVTVASHGCTTKADIAFYVERRAGAAAVAFGRRRVDVCKTPGLRAEIAFSWDELGLDPKTPVILLNPVGSPAPA